MRQILPDLSVELLLDMAAVLAVAGRAMKDPRKEHSILQRDFSVLEWSSRKMLEHT